MRGEKTLLMINSHWSPLFLLHPDHFMNMFWCYILCYSCSYYVPWFILWISLLICRSCCTRVAAIYSEALGCRSCPIYSQDVLLYLVAEVLADINTDWQRLAWPEDRVPGQQLCPTPEQVCILAWVSKSRQWPSNMGSGSSSPDATTANRWEKNQDLMCL